MKRIFFILLFFSFCFQVVFAQEAKESIQKVLKERGEVYFSFPVNKTYPLDRISRMISIDKVEGDRVFAYANDKEWQNIKSLPLNFQKELSDGEFSLLHPELYTKKGKGTWDYYPTYNQYDSIMHAFETTFPDLCELHSLGTLSSGREIFALKLSQNVNLNEAEPQFLYSSTMHGDETTGWILLMRMAEHLMSNYGTDSLSTYLLDNTELWICPNTNPDGTYYGGNQSVLGARRANANNVDINRNFPDPEDGMHPDNNVWQPETQMMMGFADTMQFSMAANLHGGYEVINYPWDTWSRLPADAYWWVYVCTLYADSAHANSPNGYLMGQGNGVTNGYAWYSVAGGRQDYMNYWHQCREMILELSNTKLLPASQLNDHWNYNKASLLHYVEQVTFGLRGVVTDSVTGLPLKAKVEIANHDKDSSHVYSHALHGDYYRMLDDGNYDLIFSAKGYNSKTFTNVSVSRTGIAVLDVQLALGTQSLSSPVNMDMQVRLFPNPVDDVLKLEWENRNSNELINIVIFDVTGKRVLEYEVRGVDAFTVNMNMLSNGTYVVQVYQGNHSWSGNIQKI